MTREEQLQAEVNELRQAVALQQALLDQRSAPVLTAMIDALSNASQAAAQGNPGAKVILDAYHRAVAQANAARSSLMVVQRNGG